MRAILTAWPETRVLARSDASDHEPLILMFPAGADGCVVRDAPPPKLTSALRGAEAGDKKRAGIRRVMERGQLDIIFQPIVALERHGALAWPPAA